MIYSFYTAELVSFINMFNFAGLYFRRNNLLWNEGLLIDFLQKKSFDLWALKFLIVASYLFNERFVYDVWVRFFLDYLLLPSRKFLFFDTFNLIWVFFLLVFVFVVVFLLLFLLSCLVLI